MQNILYPLITKISDGAWFKHLKLKTNKNPFAVPVRGAHVTRSTFITLLLY